MPKIIKKIFSMRGLMFVLAVYGSTLVIDFARKSGLQEQEDKLLGSVGLKEDESMFSSITNFFS